MTPEQEACPHRTITQLIENGEPKQGWTCDTCGEHLVTLQMMLNVLKGIGAIWQEAY